MRRNTLSYVDCMGPPPQDVAQRTSRQWNPQKFIDYPNNEEKYIILCRLYGPIMIGQSVTFVKLTKSRPASANIIEQRMTAEDHKVSALHAAFEGAQRDELFPEKVLAWTSRHAPSATDSQKQAHATASTSYNEYTRKRSRT
ncbi:uncharacterized protein F5Z01DRAFT_636919 [Emericellopsis atlantica]|uniref:Uncharacterized protein n=1 Tax=Emericellopsis atlantica TaxID=2614577 RepID=A0A9P8CNE3_9HYPO|nr:uncharacterized protein F5Z01DRAFT_636919 [Emericellopsis atlantica]KAG9253694.1 hypothetical protein F5Z01DRAFT_636919 [Emericellopsis atlantica]